MRRSGLDAFGSLANVKTLPLISVMSRRFWAGTSSMLVGRLNLRAGNEETTLYGSGGSGEPCRREVVQGLRAAGFSLSWAVTDAAKRNARMVSDARCNTV